MNTSKKPIGLIGTGLMGKAIGHRLLDHGYRLCIWNRNVEEAEDLLARGVRWSDNPLSECSRIFVCLFNSDIVRDVIERFHEGLQPQQIVIDMTTGTPDDAVRMSEYLASFQANYLEAMFSGSSEQTRNGQVTIMVGGDPSNHESCSDLWEVLSTKVVYTGPSGSATRMKLISNLVLGLNRAALAEGLAFAEMLGIDPKFALEVLMNSAAASRVMDVKGQKMIDRNFHVQARLSQHLKDVNIMLQLAGERDRVLPLTETHQRLLQVAEAMGFGELDNSSIIEAYTPRIDEKE